MGSAAVKQRNKQRGIAGTEGQRSGRLPAKIFYSFIYNISNERANVRANHARGFSVKRNGAVWRVKYLVSNLIDSAATACTQSLPRASYCPKFAVR